MGGFEMKLTVLAENTAVSSKFLSEHGLSIHVQTSSDCILFDMGASNQIEQNATSCNINLSTVSYAVLSHGHYDHGGGLLTFLDKNQTAPIFVHKGAFEPHYSRRTSGIAFIGLPEHLLNHSQIRIISDDNITFISENLSVFSGAKSNILCPTSNQKLLIQTDDGYEPDPFEHEQYGVVNEHGKLLLYTGCAHRGIVNILSRFCELYGRAPDVVIGGFHLGDPRNPLSFDESLCRKTAKALSRFHSTQYLTGHCTGSFPYKILQESLHDQIKPLSAGKVFFI